MENQVVLITGETRGFGLEMTKVFLKHNYVVCGISRSEFNYEGVYHQIGDISKEEDCHRCVKNLSLIHI